MSTNQTLECFVTFRFPKERNDCVELFRKENKKRRYCCPEPIDPRMGYMGHLMKVAPCEIEPRSIIWENMHLSTFWRVTRIILQSIFVFLLGFIAFLLIMVLNTFSAQPSTVPGVNGMT